MLGFAPAAADTRDFGLNVGVDFRWPNHGRFLSIIHFVRFFRNLPDMTILPGVLFIFGRWQVEKSLCLAASTPTQSATPTAIMAATTTTASITSIVTAANQAAGGCRRKRHGSDKDVSVGAKMWRVLPFWRFVVVSLSLSLCRSKPS